MYNFIFTYLWFLLNKIFAKSKIMFKTFKFQNTCNNVYTIIS